MCAVYGEDALSIPPANKKFRDLVLEILTSKPGRPIIGKIDVISKIIHENHHTSTSDIAKDPISHIVVLNHLHKGGHTKGLDFWAPHEFSFSNFKDRVGICAMLLNHKKLTHFSKD